MNKRTEGSIREHLAAAYLAEQGLTILEHNFRAPGGEIDLIALDGNTLVFVEVKYRKDGRMGLPEEAVTVRKQRTIRRTAAAYLSEHGGSGGRPCRFDVVAVLGEKISWIPNAF